MNDFENVPFPETTRRSLLEQTKLSTIYGDGGGNKPPNPKSDKCVGCEKTISFDAPEHLKRKGICEKCFSFFGRISAALDVEATERVRANFINKFGGLLK